MSNPKDQQTQEEFLSAAGMVGVGEMPDTNPPSTEELNEEINNLGVMKKATIFSKIISLFDEVESNEMIKRAVATNVRMGCTCLGAHLSHVMARGIENALLAMLPAGSRYEAFRNSKVVDALLYSGFSQAIVVGANALEGVHPAFGYLADGASTNSIRHSGNLLRAVLGNGVLTHPAWRLLFEKSASILPTRK